MPEDGPVVSRSFVRLPKQTDVAGHGGDHTRRAGLGDQSQRQTAPAIDEVTAMTNWDICRVNGKKRPAYADAKMASVGSWFYGCREHFADYGCELGAGTGRRIEEECPGGLRREVYFGQSIPSFVENVLGLA
jgi:hypothetical protein